MQSWSRCCSRPPRLLPWIARFHAAGGECLWALVSDGKRYVVADTQEVVGNDKDTEKSLLSLKLLPRP